LKEQIVQEFCISLIYLSLYIYKNSIIGLAKKI